MALAGCDKDGDSGTSDTADTWSNVTALSQMNGSWKGSYSQTESAEGIQMTTSAVITMTIDATAKTQAMSMAITIAYAGENIAAIWPTIKSSMESIGFKCNDANHSASMTENHPAAPLSDDAIAELLASGWQVNQNGTKLKTPPEGEMSGMIMTKQ